MLNPRSDGHRAIATGTRFVGIGLCLLTGCTSVDDGDAANALREPRVTALAETFALDPADLPSDGSNSPPSRVWELVIRGRYGEAAGLQEALSPRSWVALSLWSAKSLRRHVAPTLFRPHFEAPDGIGADGLAFAAFQVLAGRDPTPLLERTAADRRTGAEPALQLDALELHAMLAQSDDDFDQERASALLERSARRHVDPLADSGLLDLLRFRLTPSRPQYDARPDLRRRDGPDRELLHALLLSAGGDHANARRVADHVVELADEHTFDVATAHAVWLRLLEGLATRAWPNWEEIVFYLPGIWNELEENEADRGIPALRCALAISFVDFDAPDEAFDVLAELSAKLAYEGVDLGRLPAPVVGLLHAARGGATERRVAIRDVYTAFGSDARARAIAGEIAAHGANDLEVHERHRVLAENAWMRARLHADDAELARKFVLEALGLGLDQAVLSEAPDAMADILDHPSVRERTR